MKTGNASFRTISWIQNVFDVAEDTAAEIIVESMIDNDLIISDSVSHISEENSTMYRRYGSFNADTGLVDAMRRSPEMIEDSRKDARLLSNEHTVSLTTLVTSI